MASTAHVCQTAQTATLSTTDADSVKFLGKGSHLVVTNHHATEKLWFRTTLTSEVQTITFTSFDATDTIKFTHGGTESAAVTYSADVSVDIKLALESLPSIGAGNVHVTKTTTAVYVVYFTRGLAHRNVSAITCTNGTGSATGSVAETLAGGSSVAIASADDCYVVLPGKDKSIGPSRFGPDTVCSIVGNGNVFTAEIF